MSAPRLAAKVEAAALVRLAEQAGGFAAILHRGDDERGALLILVRERGRYVQCLVRLLAGDGLYSWSRIGPEVSVPGLDDFLARRRSRDPDEWQIELDIPLAERFIAETIAVG